MPENINDSPARYEENEDFLRDPMSNTAKPYSRKQKEANYNHARKTWLYHKTEGAKLFDKDEVEDAFEDGWVDVPFKHPNNPKHVAPTKEEKESPEYLALKEEAEGLGIKVDKRWGLKKLTEEIMKTEDD